MAERLARKFATFSEIVDAPPKELSRLVPNAVLELLKQPMHQTKALERAESIEEKAAQLGVEIYSIFDDQYPARLKIIPDPPLLLYVRGRLAGIERSVACIGTREPSIFGEEVTRRLVSALVDADWTIVSGLAIGVDTLSHVTALSKKGRTVAVMAGGLDDVYPKKNAKLADEIVANDGALVSEQPFGSPPIPANLVKRDRLQSGLSVATFVMQTDIKGGSMHTVKYTLQQCRLLYAPVPQGRHAVEPKSQGILALTQLTGEQLAETLRADDNYRLLLLHGFKNRPVALPLESRADYSAMLEKLDREAFSGSAPVGQSQPQQRSLF